MTGVPRAFTLWLWLCAVAAGCGGDPDGRATPRGSASNGGDPCSADDGLTFSAVEAFEDGVSQDWYTNNDAEGGTLSPPRDAKPLPLTELSPPRCGQSTRALQIKGTGLKLWGLVGYNRPPGAPPTAGPFDASGWDGLSFWVRRGPGAVGRTLFASVAEKYTDQGGASEFPGGKPYCLFDDFDVTNTCDRFGVGVGLDTEWRFFAIRFDEMRQRGFGVPSPNPGPDRNILGLNFGFESGDWDFFLDDVAFFRE